ncbi:MAG: histidine kinase dimerization/phospho-acceptor domain-containing protein [bacterium]
MNEILRRKRLQTYLISAALLIAMTAIPPIGIYRLMIDSRTSSAKTFTSQNLGLARDMLSTMLTNSGADALFLSGLTSLEIYLESNSESDLRLVARDFKRFADRRKDQLYMVRFIDVSGQEKIRVLKHGDLFSILPDDQLGQKEHNHYFQDSNSLDRGMIYVSVLELSSADTLGAPLVPALRFGTPVFDFKGQRRGVVITNYEGSELLGSLGLEDPRSRGWSLTFYGLGNDRKDNEYKGDWWFTFPDRVDTVMTSYPQDLASQFYTTSDGLFVRQGSVYGYSTLNPIIEAQLQDPNRDGRLADELANIGARTYLWKLIAQTPRESIQGHVNDQFNTIIWIIGAALIPLLGLLWLLIDRQLRRKEGRKIDQERQKLETARKLARSIAHEIRQPLTGLQLTSDLLKIYSQDPKQLQVLANKTSELVDRIELLVKQLLDLTELRHVPYLGDIDILDLSDVNKEIKKAVAEIEQNVEEN